jgi:transcriptional regulator with XRE-family HTH domain
MLNLQDKDAGRLLPYAVLAMPNTETMGDRIRTLRQARGLTQEQLGEEVGVSKSAVSQWEDGSVENIKLKTFLKLIEVLRTHHDYLIWGPERTDSRARRTGQ